jgi:3-isopropylmalate dehydrogenase
MQATIAAIAGDGIGQEIMVEALKVLKSIGKNFDHKFTINPCVAGGVSIEKYNTPITDENFEVCEQADAILLGNIGGQKWKDSPLEQRPERVLFRLRGELGFSVNLRPIFINEDLKSLSPLKDEVLTKGLDVMVIRDVTGGSLPSEKYSGTGEFGREAFDKDYYNEAIVSETAKWAFEIAEKRSGKLTSIDKANGLISSALWRKVMTEQATEYPKVQLSHKLVDNCAQEVIAHGSNYDVLVAPNLFGDILSDELAGMTGAVEILPSATLSLTGKGMYEPNQLHNTKYEIIGKDIANPIGLILSVALMLRHTFKLEQEAKVIERAVNQTLAEGYATADICDGNKKLVGTKAIGALIVDAIETIAKEK